MNRKLLLKVFLSLALFAFMGAGSVFSLDKDGAENLRLTAIQTAKFAIAADSPEHPTSGQTGSPSAGSYIGATSSAGKLGCIPGESPDDPIRGLTVGCTYYDYQKNGTMDRQIGTVFPTHVINFTWMNQDNDCATCARNVRYESWDPDLGALGSGRGGEDIGGDLNVPNRSGYTTIDAATNGTAVNGHHWNKNFGGAGSRYHVNVFQNQTPSQPDFVGSALDSLIFDTIPGWLAGDQTIWPRIAYTNAGANSVTHIVAATTNTSSNYFVYTRRVGTAGAWSPAFIVGFMGTLTHTVTASRTNNDVGIGWLGGRGDQTANNCSIDRSNGLLSGQWDNDAYYMKSTDAGASWAPCVNITLRDSTGGFAPNGRNTILFDVAGNFHMVWNATVWTDYGGPFTFQSRLFHWSDDGTNAVRALANAVYDPTNCNSGAFNQNVSQPQLTECDGKLYVTYVEFASVPDGRGDDCSVFAANSPGGAANGDLKVTVSSNGGFNWDPPRNLTNTYTPGCDTLPGGANPDCDSDAWPSAIRYGIDLTAGTSNNNFDGLTDLTANLDASYTGSNYVVLMYINDGSPGGAIQAEGGWTNNMVKSVRYGCVAEVSASVLASSLPVGQAISDPAHVLPGTDSSFAWKLENVGNADMTYSVAVVEDVPVGNIAVSGGTGFISAGAVNFDDLTITMNPLLAGEQNATAKIVVSGSFVSSPDTFLIDYAIADVQLLVFDTLDNYFVASNHGSMAAQNSFGLGGNSFDFVGDPSECDTTSIARKYNFDGGPIVGYNGGVIASGAFDFSFVDSFSLRPLGDPTLGTENGYQFLKTGPMATQDSVLGVEADYWTLPGNDPLSTLTSTWKTTISRISYYNRTGMTIPDVVMAAGFDWDVPSDTNAQNNSAISPNPATEFYVYQQGAEFGTDTGNGACRDNSTRYAATIFVADGGAGFDPFISGNGDRMDVGLKSLYTRPNGFGGGSGSGGTEFIGNTWNSGSVDSMLRDPSLTGLFVFSSGAVDSQFLDLHTMLNAGAYDLAVGDTAQLWFRTVTGFGTQAEFEAAVTAAIALETPITKGCCKIAGDANSSGSVNIGDATFIIAYIFSGGPTPQCLDQANANASPTINIADATYLIAFIFSGGAFPICENIL